MLPDSSLTVFYHDQEYAIGNTKHAIDMMQLATPWLLVLIEAESTAQDTLRFLQLWSCHQNHHSCLTVQILQRNFAKKVNWPSDVEFTVMPVLAAVSRVCGSSRGR